jgi:hypothetical protein
VPGLGIGDHVPHTVCGLGNGLVELLDESRGRLFPWSYREGTEDRVERIKYIRFHRLARLRAQMLEAYVPVLPALIPGPNSLYAQRATISVKTESPGGCRFERDHFHAVQVPPAFRRKPGGQLTPMHFACRRTGP